MSSKVLIIGIDGARHDTLGAVPTPALDRIAAAGFLSPVRASDAGPTISGPGWATIFTGALADRHRIVDNDLSPNGLAKHPDVVELARRQRPEVQTFVAASWGPLVIEDSGGPLFADGGWFPPRGQAHEQDEWQRADQAVTDATAAAISGLDPERDALVIAYLGGPDEVAHLVGCGESYRAMVTDSDRRTGELVEAIAARPDAADWTVLVVTDHGHVEEGGHGGESDLERTAWIAASGPDVPTVAPAHLEQADIAGHTARVLALELPEGSHGVPLGTR